MEKSQDIYDLPMAIKYCCPNPNCSEPFNDRDSYMVDGEKYPKIYNYTQDPESESWAEEHKCEKCKNKFYLNNGT